MKINGKNIIKAEFKLINSGFNSNTINEIIKQKHDSTFKQSKKRKIIPSNLSAPKEK